MSMSLFYTWGFYNAFTDLLKCLSLASHTLKPFWGPFHCIPLQLTLFTSFPISLGIS